MSHNTITLCGKKYQLGCCQALARKWLLQPTTQLYRGFDDALPGAQSINEIHCDLIISTWNLRRFAPAIQPLISISLPDTQEPVVLNPFGKQGNGPVTPSRNEPATPVI